MIKNNKSAKMGNASHWRTGDRMGEPRTYTASEARNNFSDLIDTAIHEGPVFVTKRKKTVAVVSIDYLKALTDIEAKFDAEKAQESLKEFLKQGGKPLKKVKEELGIP